MGVIKRAFEQTELIFIISMMLPFVLQFDVHDFKFLIELCLGIVMFFGIRPFFQHKFNLRSNFRGMLNAVVLNYILLSMMYLITSFLLLGDDGIRKGYVLLAIVPPAISIIPLCYLSKCDPEVADSSIFISYLLALIIIPVSLYLLYGKTVNFFLLAQILATLIVVPSILAFLLRKSKASIFKSGKAITNFSLGIVIFVSISLNRGAFLDFSNPEIKMIYLINFIAIFLTGFLVYHTTKTKAGFEKAITYTLYSSQKNVGTSITLGILLFTPIVAIPAIIALAMQFIFFIFLEKVIIKYDN